MADRRKIFPYDVRFYPIRPPSAGVFDAPRMQICLNREWIAHVDGVIERLRWMDAWKGTDEEKEAAVSEVEKLLAALGSAGECDVVDCLDIEFRIEAGHLEQRCNGGEWEDLGQVVGEQGEPGAAGAPGTDGREVEFQKSATHIQWRYVGEAVWIDLVPLSELQGADGADGTDGVNGQDGEDGQDGEGVAGSDTSTVPPPNGDPGDGLRCSVALNVTKYLRTTWTEMYASDFLDLSNNIAAGLVGAAAISNILFPGIAIGVAAIALVYNVANSLVQRINQGEINNFDDEAEERLRCGLFCSLAADGDFTVSVRDAWAQTIRDDPNFVNGYGDIIADFLEASPIDAFRWVAWTSSEIDPAACGECECDDNVINITYPGNGSGDASVNSGDTTVMTFGNQGGIGWLTAEFDAPVEVEIISYTGAPVIGSTPITLCWKDSVTMNYDHCNTDTYVDIADCRGISIWNTTPGATLTVRLTLV